jgi:ADP-ribosylglycohydrolase
MYGAIIGDIVGSKYEFNNIKTKEFPFISEGCEFTDDTVMTVAVARALLHSREEKLPFKPNLIKEMQKLGRQYPYAGYGGMFSSWLHSDNPRPYNSFGNGSAMRVSPCGLIAVSLEEAISLARASAEVTHNHPEGIKGAEATAAAIFLAKSGRRKEEIGSYICDHYYNLSQTLDEIRPTYRFNETCQNTVPQAIIAFLESTGYEDAIRNAVSLGGDSDTLAAITGGIAWSYYRFNNRTDKETHKKEGRIWPENCDKIVLDNHIDSILPEDFVDTIEQFDIVRMHRFGTFDRTGFCSPIILE